MQNGVPASDPVHINLKPEQKNANQISIQINLEQYNKINHLLPLFNTALGLDPFKIFNSNLNFNENSGELIYVCSSDKDNENGLTPYLAGIIFKTFLKYSLTEEIVQNLYNNQQFLEYILKLRAKFLIQLKNEIETNRRQIEVFSFEISAHFRLQNGLEFNFMQSLLAPLVALFSKPKEAKINEEKEKPEKQNKQIDFIIEDFEDEIRLFKERGTHSLQKLLAAYVEFISKLPQAIPLPKIEELFSHHNPSRIKFIDLEFRIQGLFAHTSRFDFNLLQQKYSFLEAEESSVPDQNNNDATLFEPWKNRLSQPHDEKLCRRYKGFMYRGAGVVLGPLKPFFVTLILFKIANIQVKQIQQQTFLTRMLSIQTEVIRDKIFSLRKSTDTLPLWLEQANNFLQHNFSAEMQASQAARLALLITSRDKEGKMFKGFWSSPMKDINPLNIIFQHLGIPSSIPVNITPVTAPSDRKNDPQEHKKTVSPLIYRLPPKPQRSALDMLLPEDVAMVAGTSKLLSKWAANSADYAAILNGQNLLSEQKDLPAEIRRLLSDRNGFFALGANLISIKDIMFNIAREEKMLNSFSKIPGEMNRPFKSTRIINLLLSNNGIHLLWNKLIPANILTMSYPEDPCFFYHFFKYILSRNVCFEAFKKGTFTFEQLLYSGIASHYLPLLFTDNCLVALKENLFSIKQMHENELGSDTLDILLTHPFGLEALRQNLITVDKAVEINKKKFITIVEAVELRNMKMQREQKNLSLLPRTLSADFVTLEDHLSNLAKKHSEQHVAHSSLRAQ